MFERLAHLLGIGQAGQRREKRRQIDIPPHQHVEITIAYISARPERYIGDADIAGIIYPAGKTVRFHLFTIEGKSIMDNLRSISGFETSDSICRQAIFILQ